MTPYIEIIGVAGEPVRYDLPLYADTQAVDLGTPHQRYSVSPWPRWKIDLYEDRRGRWSRRCCLSRFSLLRWMARKANGPRPLHPMSASVTGVVSYGTIRVVGVQNTEISGCRVVHIETTR